MSGVRHTEHSSDVRDREHRLTELLKRSTFLLGTLCLAHEVYPPNVERLLEDVSDELKERV